MTWAQFGQVVHLQRSLQGLMTTTLTVLTVMQKGSIQKALLAQPTLQHFQGAL
jgi:hypothetical protein